jgi:hypothetical protein
MFRILADQNFDNRIVRGLLRRARELLDLVRVQDVGLSAADDPFVLAWAAEGELLVLTHDVSTMADYAYERVAAGQCMPGVFEVARSMPIGQAIEELLLVVECSVQADWEGRVIYLYRESESSARRSAASAARRDRRTSQAALCTTLAAAELLRAAEGHGLRAVCENLCLRPAGHFRPSAGRE